MSLRQILTNPQYRITFGYLVIASIWILFSDSLLLFLNIDIALFPAFSILKGISFVLVTSFILYVVVRREFNLRNELESELREQVEQVRQSQSALQQSEQRFRKAVEEAPQPMMILAEDGEVMTLSRTWTDITGYTRDQIKTLDAWTELAYGTRKKENREHVHNLFDLKERVDEGEFIIRCADGTYRTWVFSSTPLGQLPDGRRVLISIAADVTKQKRAEILASENQRLKASFHKERERNSLIQRIISALSHDLRTPLTVISSSRDLLSNYFDQLTPEKRLDKLDAIGRQVQFALELLEDTVNMARGNLSDTPFRPEPVNIALLCQVSIDEIQIANKLQHKLQFNCLNEIEKVSLDETLVNRILLNLLSNAIKYSPEDSEIWLELDQYGDWVVLRVIDKGIGIKEGDLPNIFEPFYRARDVQSVQGTGLGLSIVKDCVDRHEGRIHVQSTHGQGSTFTVELPYKAVEDNPVLMP